MENHHQQAEQGSRMEFKRGDTRPPGRW